MTEDERYAFERANLGVQSSLDSINTYLDKSQGQPTMSPDDVKMVLLFVKFALENLERMTKTLSEEPEEAPAKFKFWKKFRK